MTISDAIFPLHPERMSQKAVRKAMTTQICPAAERDVFRAAEGTIT